MADNEGLRRIAYHKGMYVYAEKGGIATWEAPNVGNSGLRWGLGKGEPKWFLESNQCLD